MAEHRGRSGDPPGKFRYLGILSSMASSAKSQDDKGNALDVWRPDVLVACLGADRSEHGEVGGHCRAGCVRATHTSSIRDVLALCEGGGSPVPPGGRRYNP